MRVPTMPRGSQGHASEGGAVAIMVALCAVVLFGVAALSVDLGNAFSRSRDVQAQADFAALAGAEGLGSNSKTPTDLAVLAVTDYLNENQPQDDSGDPCVVTRTCVTAADLIDDTDNTVDGDPAEQNGEVYFLPGDRMRVLAPVANVDFGLGGIFGISDRNVFAEATIGIRSGGTVMPFFAVDGCDYGLQTISDPPPGPAPTIDVALDGGSETTNSASVDSVTPEVVALDANPHPTVRLTGTNLANTNRVGFFLNDNATYHTVGLTADGDGDSIVARTGTTVDVKVPGEVLAAEQSWYVRVQVPSGSSFKWSETDEDDMGVLRVGSAVLECEGAPSDGNFGTLKLPRSDVGPASWLPENIAEGLQDPLSLGLHAEAANPWTCTAGDPGVVITQSSPVPDGPEDLIPSTNCVDTDTGLADNVATEGLITMSGNNGRLNKDTTAGCGADSADRNKRWNTGIGSFKINDDLLTCFMLDSSTPISALTVENYLGPALLSQKIYSSPRFFYMPVLGVEPANGGSERYSIVDFRAGFITDQPPTATKSGMEMGSSTDHNGISIAGNKVSTVKVIFFDLNVLPTPPDDAPDFAYLGTGPKLIRLVD